MTEVKPEHIQELYGELESAGAQTVPEAAIRGTIRDLNSDDREGFYAHCDGHVVNADDNVVMYHVEGPWPDGESERSTDITLLVHTVDTKSVDGDDPSSDDLTCWYFVGSPEGIRENIVYQTEYVTTPEHAHTRGYSG